MQMSSASFAKAGDDDSHSVHFKDIFLSNLICKMFYQEENLLNYFVINQGYTTDLDEKHWLHS